jgi:hypothetical protein
MKTKLYILSIFLIIFFQNINSQSKVYQLLRYKTHLFIELTVNDKSCLFIIDSGSSYSLIDISKSKEFNFNYIEFGEQKYITANGTCQVYIVYDYKFSELNYDFFGINLNKITTYLNKEFEIKLPVLGILGADFLCDKKVKLNYENNTIEF